MKISRGVAAYWDVLASLTKRQPALPVACSEVAVSYVTKPYAMPTAGSLLTIVVAHSLLSHDPCLVAPPFGLALRENCVNK